MTLHQRRPRNWKRALFKVGVFLLLGAIVNVAVAWGLGLLPDLSYTSENTTYQPDEGYLQWWTANAPAGFPLSPGGVYERRQIGRQFVLMYERAADGASRTLGHNVGRFRSGWPSWSMQSAAWVDRTTRSVINQDHWVVPSGWPRSGRGLSMKPIWPGFAINTIFYAIVLSLLWVARGKVRRMFRVRHHRCPACGHIIASGTCANGLCSECGAKLPTKWSRPSSVAIPLQKEP